MQIPQKPTGRLELMQSLSAARALEILNLGLGPEVDGRYLHWEELRLRPAPPGLSSTEWWLAIASARQFLRSELPLVDAEGRPFHYARTAGLDRLLHRVDRELGSPLERAEPSLANPDVRDRYLVQSLMEEAITSSQLEGAATTRTVARDMLLSGRRPRTTDERMIANNFQAMQLLRTRLQTPLSRDFLLELHATLTEGTMAEEDVGRFRRPEELVTVQEVGGGRDLHVPPPSETLEERIHALCQFANDEGDDPFIHPVVRATALHFMIGYEHPFVDGNGRTARALFYWSLLRHEYWLTEFISISRVIQRAKARYARAFLFTETDSNDLTYFLLHQLDVIRTALQELGDYLKRKTAELRDAEKLVRAESGLNHRQRAVIADALRHPERTITIEAHRRANDVVYQTARQDLLNLAQRGLLLKRQVGRAFEFVVPGDLRSRL